MSERLNKFLALHLGISRREADERISKRRVTIDGRVAELGSRVEEDSLVLVDQKPVISSTAYQYLLFNKPVGYVSSRRAQGNIPTIYSLLPKEYHSLKPVGRLDKDSSGLLLLSNDGDFTFRMTHPKFRKTKVYEVTLNHPLEPLHQQMIADFGIDLPDGKSQLGLTRINENDRNAWIVTMREGRNRQIRRTFAALGYSVVRLHRVQFGSYDLQGLAPGKYQLVEGR